MSGQISPDTTNGRLLFKIDGSIAVSACDDGWNNSDVNGSEAVSWIKMTFDNTKSFWTIVFSNSNKLYIDGQA